MKLQRDLLLGFVKLHILHHANIEPIYGSGISHELEEHGYELSWGTLYPVLHALEADGLLARENRLVDGKIRKYYSITAVGREALRKATEKAVELADEIVDDEPRPALYGPKDQTRTR